MTSSGNSSAQWSRRALLKGAGLGAAATVAAPLLAACSGSTGSGGGAGSKKLVIGSFQDPAMQPFRHTYVKQFQHETGIQVVYAETNYNAWYQAAKSDGLNKTGAYDIYVMDDNWVPEFAAGGIVQNMTKLGFKPNPGILAKGLDQGYWPPKSGPRLSAFKNDTPQLYALVIIDDVNLLYYDKRYFSSPPQTWDEIYAAMKSKAKPPQLYGWSARGVKGNPVVQSYLPFLNSYGANFVNDDWTPGFAGAAGVAALERLLSFLPYMSTSTPEFDTDQETGLMLQGKCMALNDYTGTAVTEIDNPSNSKVVGQINLANTPKQVKHGPAIGTFICGIASGSANTEGAMKFLEWFTSDRIQTQFARQGGNAAVTSAALHDSQAVAKYRWLPAIAQSVEASTPKPRTPDEPKFEDILGTQLNLALLDALQQKGNYGKIAQKWLKVAHDQMAKVLEQNKNIYF